MNFEELRRRIVNGEYEIIYEYGTDIVYKIRKGEELYPFKPGEKLFHVRHLFPEYYSGTDNYAGDLLVVGDIGEDGHVEDGEIVAWNVDDEGFAVAEGFNKRDVKDLLDYYGIKLKVNRRQIEWQTNHAKEAAWQEFISNFEGKIYKTTQRWVDINYEMFFVPEPLQLEPYEHWEDLTYAKARDIAYYAINAPDVVYIVEK